MSACAFGKIWWYFTTRACRYIFNVVLCSAVSCDIQTVRDIINISSMLSFCSFGVRSLLCEPQVRCYLALYNRYFLRADVISTECTWNNRGAIVLDYACYESLHAVHGKLSCGMRAMLRCRSDEFSRSPVSTKRPNGMEQSAMGVYIDPGHRPLSQVGPTRAPAPHSRAPK